MSRSRSELLALAVALSIASPAAAVVIDSFESGPFSVSRSTEGSDHELQTPNPAHCIATQREVFVNYGPTSQGVMSAELVPASNVDDGIVASYSDNWGNFNLIYSGGPWDLTAGGTLNQLSLRIVGGGPGIGLYLYVKDDGGSFNSREAVLSGTGDYNFLLSSFAPADPTSITELHFYFTSTTGGSITVQNISTTSGSGVTLIYGIDTPTTFTYLCTSRGANTIGWDWAIGWPTLPVLAGPQLTVTGLSGSDCQGVLFEGYDSAPGGGFGEMALVDVTWQAPTFDDAAFEMYLITDPTAPYVAQLVGDPVVTLHESAFTVGYDVQISDLLGVPDGTVHQDLIVSAAPGQEMYFDYADVLPYFSGGGVGYSLSFGITAADVDPADPLLEIYTTGSFADDAGFTGVGPGALEPLLANLAAHPSVTRSGTRFVLSGTGLEGVRSEEDRPGGRTIEIFDVAGRRVRELPIRGGEARWDAADAHGRRVPAGVYFGRASGSSGTARVVILR